MEYYLVMTYFKAGYVENVASWQAASEKEGSNFIQTIRNKSGAQRT